MRAFAIDVTEVMFGIYRKNLLEAASGASARIKANGVASCSRGRFVRDAFRALPPDFDCGIRRDVMRGEVSILIVIPLACQIRTQGSQIVVADENAVARANRAPRLIASTVLDSRLPIMPAFPVPPDFPGRVCSYIVWRKFTIQCWMPFGCKGREADSKRTACFDFHIRSIRCCR
jgi:hypothetical protein